MEIPEPTANITSAEPKGVFVTDPEKFCQELAAKKAVEANQKKSEDKAAIVAISQTSLGKLQDKVAKTIIEQSENVAEKTELLGKIELGIYAVFSGLSAFNNFKRGLWALPNSTFFANFLEAFGEIFAKKLQQGEGSVSGIFETTGDIVSRIFSIKDKETGELVKGAKAIEANAGHVLGGLITLLNSFGIVDSLFKTLRTVTGYKQNTQTENEGWFNRIIGGTGSVAALANAGSMWMISSMQENYARALHSIKGSEDEQYIALAGGASEDARCGLKSLVASIVSLIDANGSKWTSLIDTAAGFTLCVMGFNNGRELLKHGEEDESVDKVPSVFTQKVSSFGNLLMGLGQKYLNFFDQKMPQVADFKEIFAKPNDEATLEKFHAALV